MIGAFEERYAPEVHGVQPRAASNGAVVHAALAAEAVSDLLVDPPTREAARIDAPRWQVPVKVAANRG